MFSWSACAMLTHWSISNHTQGNNLQLCLDLSGSTLHKEITTAMLAHMADNVYEENNLCNAVSTILGQHCIRVLSSQFCPNTSETTLHKETTCTVLA